MASLQGEMGWDPEAPRHRRHFPIPGRQLCRRLDNDITGPLAVGRAQSLDVVGWLVRCRPDRITHRPGGPERPERGQQEVDGSATSAPLAGRATHPG